MEPTDIIKFGPHDLQQVALWLPKSLSPCTNWIIFIHGGAWRDPSITHINYAIPTITELPQDLAFASISYRLSSHPDHPQDTNIPATALRAAKHPDHAEDVASALAAIHTKHTLTAARMTLVGHSCGATLAFQAVESGFRRERYPVPARIVGLAGIYSIGGIAERHKDSPWASVYRDFVVGAFGEDERQWEALSPAEGFGVKALQGTQILLCTAKKDSLVEEEQLEDMKKALEKVGINSTMMSVEGDHDEMWQIGSRQAEAVTRALEHLERVHFIN